MTSANSPFGTNAEALLKVMPVGVFRISLGRAPAIVFANELFVQMLGYSQQELLRVSLNALFPTPEWNALQEQALVNGTAFIPHLEVVTKSTHVLVCSLSLVADKEGRGKAQYLDGVLQDLSSLERSERDLKESKALFDTVFNNSAAAIIVADEAGKITAWNPFTEDMLGMEKLDLFNKPIAELYPIREWERVVAMSEKRKGHVTDIGAQIYKKDGAVLNVGLSLSLIRNSSQKIVGSVAIMRDMTQQKAAERKIRESEAKIRIILDHSAAAITLTDEQERIITWNRYTEQLLGRTRDDLHLKHVSSLYPQEEWDKIRAENIRQSGSRHNLETKVIKSDGSFVDVNLSVNVLKDSNGKIIGSVGILQDITEQKKINQMLIAAKTAAEEANNTKSMFLANMSHEFRTPMNTILGLIDLTLDSQLAPEQRDNLLTIRNAGDVLLSLLNDILDLSKVESGKIQLENIELSLTNILQSVCKGLQVLAKNKNLELVWEVDPQIPETVIGDPVRIRQILVNLINNAIKFTFRGQIMTRIQLLSKTVDLCELQFSVKDQGVGIPQDKLEKIFEAFTQADASTTRRFGGTGLGLAISKGIVEMMGGRIWVESEEFKGSTFNFTGKFPVVQKLAVTPSSSSGCDTVTLVTRDLKNLRILLAEDNVVNQKIAAKMLEKRGWQVQGAENGKQVLEYLDKDRYDLILMDAQMPVLDGFEATRLIRESEKRTGQHIPIVALTASAMSGDRQRCLDAGMDGYVSKPIDRQKLYEAVEQVLQTGHH